MHTYMVKIEGWLWRGVPPVYMRVWKQYSSGQVSMSSEDNVKETHPHLNPHYYLVLRLCCLGWIMSHSFISGTSPCLRKCSNTFIQHLLLKVKSDHRFAHGVIFLILFFFLQLVFLAYVRRNKDYTNLKVEYCKTKTLKLLPLKVLKKNTVRYIISFNEIFYGHYFPPLNALRRNKCRECKLY